MEVRNLQTHLAAAALALASFACRPVVTVGWGEVLLLTVVFFLVLGPLVLRFLRYVRKLQNDVETQEKD